MNKSKILALEEKNAEVLIELITGSNISETLRIAAMERLLGSKERQGFSRTVFEEKLSFGACPHCNFECEWLVPEDALNMFGWVSHHEDDRVLEYTNAKSCSTYEQACKKRRINI